MLVALAARRDTRLAAARCSKCAALLAYVLVVLVVLVAGAGAGAATDGPFGAADRAMRDRIRTDRLQGGGLLVERGGAVLHRRLFSGFRGGTVIPIASASKWLTSATLMTLVDDGRLALDDPVARHLPGFGGAKSEITVRELLSHTTGLASPSCIGDPGSSLEACVARIAAGPAPASPPGKEFHYSSVGYQVAGRIVEVLTGRTFEQAFQDRIARPLGMDRTTFTAISGHPEPAASATSTMDDYARFLAMLAAGGTAASRRVLTATSVAEIERDQVRGLDTRSDGAVQTTGIPTYGLGVWRDLTGPADEIRVVSGNGAFGFYPWIDRVHNTFGIVAVADLRNGSSHAVPVSQRIARSTWEAAAGT